MTRSPIGTARSGAQGGILAGVLSGVATGDPMVGAVVGLMQALLQGLGVAVRNAREKAEKGTAWRFVLDVLSMLGG